MAMYEVKGTVIYDSETCVSVLDAKSPAYATYLLNRLNTGTSLESVLAAASSVKGNGERVHKTDGQTEDHASQDSKWARGFGVHGKQIKALDALSKLMKAYLHEIN